MNKETPDEILVEADIYAMLDRLDAMEYHIREYLPSALYLKEDSSPNVHTRWGAILYHLQYVRATLRSFL